MKHPRFYHPPQINNLAISAFPPSLTCNVENLIYSDIVTGATPNPELKAIVHHTGKTPIQPP